MKKPKFSEKCQDCQAVQLDSLGTLLYVCPSCENFEFYMKKKRELTKKIREYALRERVNAKHEQIFI